MMRRVVVIGTSGSGKSTFAAALSTQLNLPHVEIDALHWGPNWTPREDFRERVAAMASTDEWVIDGNYGKVRELIWPRADTIIWLDFSLPFILKRLICRTARRCIRREILWAGNRENALVQIFSRESIIRWCVSSFYRHRREYPDLLLQAARRGTHIVRFRTPKQAHAWFQDLRESVRLTDTSTSSV